ncbi:hypothetical protein [Streptomyces sp. PTD5-9]|uniref:hypothetical protein n=1 Tax=Streptomyces sp. PTD5-9 TaxID=3120150 RepID=UPI00300B15F0
MLCIRGIVLPEREERVFLVVDGVLRAGGPPGGLADMDTEMVVDGGWLLPGLVDVHTHPGALGPVFKLPSFGRRPGRAASGACDRKAEDRPRTGRTRTTPTTPRARVPGVARQAAV